jgi:hypothetical protein
MNVEDLQNRCNGKKQQVSARFFEEQGDNRRGRERERVSVGKGSDKGPLNGKVAEKVLQWDKPFADLDSSPEREKPSNTKERVSSCQMRSSHHKKEEGRGGDGGKREDSGRSGQLTQ